jgi:hypothetical protein
MVFAPPNISIVTPANAGVQLFFAWLKSWMRSWIPAFAGMTDKGVVP